MIEELMVLKSEITNLKSLQNEHMTLNSNNVSNVQNTSVRNFHQNQINSARKNV